MTLVRDPAGLLPLRPAGDATILAIMPTPTDLTPADTSSTVVAGLASGLRTQHGRVDEIVVPASPTAADIAAVRDRAAAAAAVVVGTLDASREPSQAELVRAVASAGRPVVAVALRTPWDVGSYPPDVAAVCTYSIHPPSMAALAASLFGLAPWPGRVPSSGAHEPAPMTLRDEILEQPEAAARFLISQSVAIDALARAVRSRDIEHVVIVARGTSDHAAIYAQYVLGVGTG